MPHTEKLSPRFPLRGAKLVLALGLALLPAMAGLCAPAKTAWAADTTAEPMAGTVIVHPGDGALMVYVPAGEFVMGLDEADVKQIAADLGFAKPQSLWAFEAYPKHTVKLPGYFIDRCEVTVDQWRRFVAATGIKPHSTESTQRFERPAEQLLPAGAVVWDEAKRYAAWAGKEIPSEAQWEKAARGPDGRCYPWGNEAPIPERGHFGTVRHSAPGGKPAKLYTFVGRYPTGASPYGALDMLGNQYEWTSELLEPYPGNPEADKMKDYAGKAVCLRGGSWYHGWIGFYAAKRFGLKPEETYYHIGFRTVWSPPADYFTSAAYTQAKMAVPERRKQLEAMRQLAEAAEAASLPSPPAKTPRQ